MRHRQNIKNSQVCRMNQQNISKTPDLLVKRKRGRPRKDESIARNVKQHTQPPLAMAAPQPPPQVATIFPASNNASKVDPNMVGQVVTCVIDGIFDNGYLLSACVGPNNTVLRGIVFQQGHVAPVTPANDVAPHVEMCTRGEFPIPPSNPGTSIQISTPELPKQPAQPVAMQNYQNTPVMVTGGSSSSLQQESLTMIQQNNLMDVFEMSKTVEGSQACDQRARNEHVVSDPTAENFPERETVVPKATELEPVVNEQPEGEKPEVITPVETVVENQPSMANDGLQQESQAQTGEMSGIDANQVQNREIGVDLSLSNFPEI
ncbi:hypothetical protein HanRHA438_Chr11g0512621 [Helianthus annuus]|uniref:AT hook, DNA-binding motif-containing protein n=2 Tax=Helianthus annuus TaxID=4232 RepID=A0A251UP70_HELAN|nr:hypothetical protein HanXRQr2_Chr11g0499861 [Helianthus annuus]KAJ0510209.1 hypothetical protein HanIR_Chr11g0538131 [Helianthus annuus]KAJ0871461.1 hypothetical protein HanRHA438_Chr11g0512621 [Helianthus annuus]KAJ0875861.1 hypothetical protein HanPSC8_Chr11g0481561 [Helianthus annuus]